VKDPHFPKNQSSNDVVRSPLEWVRWVPLVLLVLIFCAAVLVGARIILVPMLGSLALAYLLAPVVSWFEKRGWARSSSVLLAITSATITLVLILIFILPSLWVQLRKSYDQARDLVDDPNRRHALLEKINQVSPAIYEVLKPKIDEYGNSAKIKDSTYFASLFGIAGGWLQKGLFRIVDVTASLLDLFLIPFFVYYLLADYGAMRARLDRLIPPRYRKVMETLISQISYVISSYVRSQLVIALAMGAMYSVGFAILRVPLALTIGLFSGLLNFVPYLGTLTSLVLSLSFVALAGGGWTRIAGVVIVVAVVQSVEGYYLTPKLLGGRLNLHPLWVLLGLMIGGNLFGLLGIILAVPVLAVAKVVLNFLEEIYQQSAFYRDSGLGLLTEQGDPVILGGSGQGSAPATGLILGETAANRPRRTIVTTSELRSRIKDSKSSLTDESE
jgi:predicted PurR-regulated permease PerM